MVDYLKTGRWISARDALPPEREKVLAIVYNKPVVAYMANGVWYCNDWPSLQIQTIGARTAVDYWMHIPPVEDPPETIVVIEALGANLSVLSLHTDDFLARVGYPVNPVSFNGATISFDGSFDRIGPIESRPISRLRVIAEYLP